MEQSRKTILWGCVILALGIALSGGIYEVRGHHEGRAAVWSVNRWTGAATFCTPSSEDGRRTLTCYE